MLGLPTLGLTSSFQGDVPHECIVAVARFKIGPLLYAGR